MGYSHFTFQQLDQESDRLARGFRRLGVTAGTRLVLMVRPSLEFIAYDLRACSRSGPSSS